MDKDWILLEALARATFRPIILLSSLPEHENKKVIKYNHESVKPPIILGVYRIEGKIIFTPYFYNKNLEFCIDSLKGKVQIVANLAKSVPETFRSRSILDLEVFAILTALHCMQRYIFDTKCHLLTDSRVLYYLFHQRVGDSSTKIRRWVLKLLSDYPKVILHFIRTTQNLADYLTRQGLPKGDLEKLDLKNIQITDFYHMLPKEEFTLTEWAQFCADNPQYLTVNSGETPSIHVVSFSIDQGIKNLTDQINPLTILKERLSREKMIDEQNTEFSVIIQQCLNSDDYTYSDTKHTYRLDFGLLYIKEGENFKIYVPTSMIGLLISYTHLHGHWGVAKILANMKLYYFPNMHSTVK
jgi:hypothetical protein